MLIASFYYAVFVNQAGDVNRIKFNITARTADLYLNENYDVSEEDMGRGKLLLVGLFRDKASAINYFGNSVTDNSFRF